MPEKYDVIIIGAGIGGLTAAAILARNGKKVLVLEKNPMPGGYAVNFKRGEFEFDASLHMINGCNLGGPTYKILEKCGLLDKIHFLKPQYLYRSIFPDFDLRIPQHNPQEYIKILTDHFPFEGKGIQKLFKEMSNIFYEGKRFIYSKIPLGIEMICFPFKYQKLFLYANKTYQVMLDNFLKDIRLKAIISQLWGYYGLPPTKLSSFYFSYGWHDFYHNGGYYLKGGSHALSNAFVDIVKSYGGEIILGCEVEKIIVKQNLAKGIKTTNGEMFWTDSIISNIDARKTFYELISPDYYPKSFIKKIYQMDPCISAVQLYLGLNVDLQEKGIYDYEIFVNPNYDLDSQFGACISNDIDKVFLVLTLYSNLDNTVAPKGKSVMGVIALSGYDFWKNLSEEKYKEKKIEIANLLIKRVEKIIPNLSRYIERLEVATPITMERYTGNYKGAIYGWSQLISQSGIHRLDVTNPYVKNLYLASAWTRPGGGFAGVMYSGEHVAEKILENDK